MRPAIPVLASGLLALTSCSSDEARTREQVEGRDPPAEAAAAPRRALAAPWKPVPCLESL